MLSFPQTKSLPTFCFIPCLLLAGFSSSATALEKGFYLGGQADYAQFEITNKDTIAFDDATAMAFYAGYNFLPHLGVEMGLTQYGDFSSKESDLEISLQQAHLGFSLHGKIHNNWDMFAKVLALYSSLELSDVQGLGESDDSADSGWSYEVGIAYHVNNTLSITGSAAYKHASYSDEFEYTTMTAGVGLKASF